MLQTLKAEQNRILALLPASDPLQESYATLLHNLNEVCYLLNCYAEPTAARYGAMQDAPTPAKAEAVSTTTAADTPVAPFNAPDAPPDAAEAYTAEKAAQEAAYEPITAAQCRETLSNIRAQYGVDVNGLVHAMTAELGVAKFTEIKDGVKYAELVARAMALVETK